MAPRFRPSGWAGRDALLVGTRQRVRGCPRRCWHFCCCRLFNDVPATSARFPRLDPRNRSHAPPCQVPHRCVSVARRQLTGDRDTADRAFSGPKVARWHASSRTRHFAVAVLAPYTLFRVYVGQEVHMADVAAATHSPSPCWRASPNARCTPTRWPPPCARAAQDASIRLNYGSLYGVVETLLKRGLIEEQEVVREGRRPERTVYRITDDGRTEVDEWLARAARHVGQGVPPVRGRALADGRAPARPGRRTCSTNGSARCRSGSSELDAIVAAATGNGVPRAVPRRDGLRARARRGRLRVHRTVGPRHRVGTSGRRDVLEETPCRPHADRARGEGRHMNAIVEVEGIARSFGDTQGALPASTSRCPKAVSSRCSGRTARARRRSSASCRR